MACCFLLGARQPNGDQRLGHSVRQLLINWPAVTLAQNAYRVEVDVRPSNSNATRCLRLDQLASPKKLRFAGTLPRAAVILAGQKQASGKRLETSRPAK